MSRKCILVLSPQSQVLSLKELWIVAQFVLLAPRGNLRVVRAIDRQAILISQFALEVIRRTKTRVSGVVLALTVIASILSIGCVKQIHSTVPAFAQAAELTSTNVQAALQ